MDEPANLVPRDRRWSGDALDVAPTKLQFPTWGMTPLEPHLRDLLNILRKRQWTILFVLLAVVTYVTISTFRMQPIYRASARVEIDRESTHILPFQMIDPYEYFVDFENLIGTHAKILQSETLALQTVRSVRLGEIPEFGGQPGTEGKPAAIPASVANQVPPSALGAFLGRLGVKRVPESRLLEVTFESADPYLAARVLNNHLDNFIELNFRSRYEATMQASKWLAGQLNELQAKVEKSEDRRILYERQNQIWMIDERQNIVTQKLADLNKELTEAQNDRVGKEAIYQLAHSGNTDAIPAVRESSMLQELQKKQADLSATYADALNQYGPNYPKVLRLQAQLKEIEHPIAREKVNIVNRIEGEYRAARQRELLLSQALGKQKIEANQTAEKFVQHNILKREAEANKQLYDGLLQKMKEAGISAGLRSGNIRIVDAATVPSAPSRPQRTRNILLGFLIGLVGGVGLALVREYFDNTIKMPADIERLTRLPSLALVPLFGSTDGRGRVHKLLRRSPDNGGGVQVELISHNLPKSQVSESFRSLRTALLLSQAEHPPQIIVVTSPLPEEGKTTAAVNLAVTLAQLGDHTLLIDADLRKPGVGQALSLTDGKHVGLSSYLAGVSSLELVTIPHPEITNLAAIPTGPIPPNPAELLSSHRMSEALASLRQKYKFIVIDTPPIMVATDAVILSVLADGVLLVIRSGVTPKEAFRRAGELLASVKCRVLGIVLNAVDTSSAQYYYSHIYYPYEPALKKDKVPYGHTNP